MTCKVLVISPFVPYDSVGHAGGKVHNYYLKRFNSDKDFTVKLITFADLLEKNKIDLKKYSVDYKVFYDRKKFIYRLTKLLLYNMGKKFNPLDKNGGYVDYYKKSIIIKYLNSLKKSGYKPDIIILTWTELVLMISDIKKIYSASKFVAIEHDVSYLALYRKYLWERFFIIKIFKKIKYKKLKNTEIDKLKKFDLVMPLNTKDMNLLINEQINRFSKLDYICPYFSNLSYINTDFKQNNIMFFGAMDRPENYESCIWFIENVFNKLLKIDKSFKFFIVGNRPNKKLYKYSSLNIIITGFVENIAEYFNKTLCMVVPLLFGAGIKIKVLEGMSAGLPVLTNDIGIEGIMASKDDYIYCKSKDDYINNIILLRDSTIKAKEIGNNARNFIKENFNLNKSYEKYKNNILKIKYDKSISKI